MRWRNYDKHTDKGIMFFSAASPKDAGLVLNAGINEILVSYHYLRKRKRAFMEEILQPMYERDGLFMTDSGGFSFISGKIEDSYYTEEFWIPYLEEYVEWVQENSKYIFVAANMDLDRFVGRDVVDKWNEKYFRPLEKYVQVIYLAHRDWDNIYSDPTGLRRFKQYCDRYDYVGINQTMKDYSSKIIGIANATKTRVHGFAWTSIPMIMSQPLFSVDSSSWLSGQRYGTTYVHDGKNFRAYDGKSKWRRKGKRLFCEANNVDFEKFIGDKQVQVTEFNTLNWRGARDEYMKICNAKLQNKPVGHYERDSSRKLLK